ncbi:hypothetical protein PghCCS26_26110 [Paenibacillus glycanilyticus]|uniref:PA14 domain-containing protein n=1 Tax=Paenibacillus glycanilyticus TaxID=126569 RepID=A0ABQ6NL13_9BACL|nr:hypothetical protein [Paenibacillus glycanilyticus]GMK45483.1 hypothetical protein PghCCS26_26110 [Paenibacillus glycanilyticus]
MASLYKFKLSLSIFMLIGVLFCSFYWTRVPLEGSKSSAAAAASFRFGYFSQQEGEIGDWVKKFRDVTYFAASNQLLQQHPEAQSFRLYPIYDGSATEKSFNQSYPHVPTETLSGYGKSVYSITQGTARLFFLNADRLQAAGDGQLEWIRKTINGNKQTFALAWLSEDPKLSEVWTALRQAGISAVFIGSSVYVLDLAVSQEPSEYQSAGYEHWKIWDLSELEEKPLITVLEAHGNALTMMAENEPGKVLDQLELNADNLASWDLTTLREKQDISLVGIQSLWHYHLGDDSIQSTIPEGVDPVGEGPIIETSHTEPVALPSSDWRSPEYDDSGWKTGRSPLGYTSSKELQTYVQTKLEPGSSPTYYFRRTFDLSSDPKELSGLFLHIAYEDGYVVYLNGQEVSRDAIISGVLTDSSLAFPNEFTSYRRVDLKTHLNKLVKGTNVIAVEVHRGHPGAPNLLFDLGLSVDSNGEERR